jgi:hypothetical protein
MAHASYGNHSEEPSVPTERADPNAARQKPTGGEDRPGFDLGGAKDRGGQADKGTDGGTPAAGPHADPSLVNEDSTPGTGALPEAGDRDGTDSTSS